MTNHAKIWKILHSRGILILTALVAAAGALAAYTQGGVEIPQSKGFVAGWGTDLGYSAQIQFAITALLNIGIVALILYINKAYNLLRTMTHLNATVFLILQLATPLVLYALTPGAVLAAVLLICLPMMYSLYGHNQYDTRRIFLVMAILSGCTAFDYTFTFYIPVFILACVQLRVMSLRTVLAILMGIATPWILFMGFGVADDEQLQNPYSMLSLPALDTPRQVLLASTVVLTVFVTSVSLMQNVIKFIAYNAVSRSMISVMTVLTIVSAIASILDMSHVYSYLSMLNVCAAFQFTHLFTAIHNHGRSYIVAIIVAMLYLLVFATYLLL